MNATKYMQYIIIFLLVVGLLIDFQHTIILLLVLVKVDHLLEVI